MRAQFTTSRLASAALALTICAHTVAQSPERTPAQPGEAVERLRAERDQLLPIVASDIARDFLAAVDDLPHVSPRTVLYNPDARAFVTSAAAAALDDDARAALREVSLDETFYYYTRYGTPLAYTRVLDVAAAHGLASLDGARVMDFGHGSIGQLRLMASLGAHAVGVEIDPMIPALYNQPADTATPRGSVTLAHGQWPADKAVVAAAGARFDLITSKNTLKNGYVNPPPGVDVNPRQLVRLGVDNDAFVRALADALNPGGLVVIYNLSPAPSKPDEPFKPWSDGRCPFPREAWERHGFDVLAFDVVDDDAAHAMARAFGWDKGPNPMNLDTDLFALYTVVRKRAAQ